MTYGSLIPEVKDALVTLLNARPGLSTITVGREVPDKPSDHVNATGVGEAIWIGRRNRDIGQDSEFTGETGPMIGGRLDPNEVFTVWLTIGVVKGTSSATQEAAQERAYSLLGEVLGAVFANPSLGVAAGNSSRIFLGVVSHEGSEHNRQLNKGWYCAIELGLSCMGRLTLT